MKSLVIARHGDYSYASGNLDHFGRKQMTRMAEQLKPIVGTEKVLILGSSALRGIQSAEILAQVLGVSFEQIELLWSGPDRPENIGAAIELIQTRQDEAETLILVTHMEYCDELPWHYVDATWPDKEIRFGRIDKGQAILIDCGTQTARYLG